jgi:hypothetical protein
VYRRGTNQDRERKKAGNGYSHSRECRERGEVRTPKPNEQTKGTHPLESAKGNRSGTERSEEREVLTFWRAQTAVLVRTWKESRRGRGTHSLEGAEGRRVRTWKGSERARGTYELESAEGQVRTATKTENARVTHILEEEQIRTPKQSECTRDTHSLESGERYVRS